MTVRLTGLAVSDLSEIRDHYRAIDDDIERRFLDQFDLVVERLLSFPRGAPSVEGFSGVRRARIRALPYGVFYRLEGDDILILRVLHTRRAAPDLE
ncbi:type II toxin-antitoxin system RelE/ParE family toxin [Microbacterium sp. STN6]|uniref:type II toxin-antitoxin system RelE/ParE family toxin n=1 Tax=Microbacterium sp. STN6 TaxID=2995588 RepID=UPI002260B9EE|nr:type II toxin-antitoxin system RelE/ParE family toxin [Microbacterium sp. STN6]MCX7521753.1 type II toxin-antitoxin system RelE/ParE family toxin [Microbacterium sp. STN6]